MVFEVCWQQTPWSSSSGERVLHLPACQAFSLGEERPTVFLQHVGMLCLCLPAPMVSDEKSAVIPVIFPTGNVLFFSGYF